jgi:hypothetical protein
MRPNNVALGILLFAGSAGAVYGALAPVESSDLEFPRLTEIQPYGQDTNGDGIATTEEGSFDIDGDGRFGEAERQHLGTGVYIRWAYPGDLDLSDAFFAGRVCASACVSSGGRPFMCTSNLNTVNCLECPPMLCSTVPCDFPCSCPP